MHFEKAPLKVIKAEKQYIYSETKEEYLDCVNCVAHVGHCHPQVVMQRFITFDVEIN
jgi:ethanolamine-phosphate phospho-lyase